MEKKFEAAWKEFSHACFAVVFSCNITTRDKGIELRSPNKKLERLFTCRFCNSYRKDKGCLPTSFS